MRVAWVVVASSILGTLFREPLGDFIYDILTNLFPDDDQPAQIIATFLKTYWPWALAALSAMVVLVVYGQNPWFRRRQPSPKNAGRPRRSRRGWIGVGRAGLDAQATNPTQVLPEPSMGEGNTAVEAPSLRAGRTSTFPTNRRYAASRANKGSVT